ncbi:heterokaryon incompatibility protein-domain-containing protein [Diaporthe sp. PMI_573]|nr:heterokaryon incompatibility protein-domain-containing protein [Diaporthaceae sp. PMI_573]
MSTYTALSYSWGTGGKNYKTTRQNLSKNKIHLPWEKLPATITDAIHVCKTLGIPYLWVDAICIIQSDRKDWEEQSEKMQEVYSNCVVALAAEDAADCARGFLPQILQQQRGLIPCSGN